MKKILITTPIYYVNDKPHIGHAYTTLAADVLTRFFKSQGNEVFFLTGTDEHGAKVAESAEQTGKDPKDFCDENSKLFKEAWKNLNIEYSHFIRTTDKKHEERVAGFLNKLKEKGVVYEKEYKGLYCTGCEKFLIERELVDGLCSDHKTKPEKVSEKNYFFKLKDYLGDVEKLIKTDKLKIQPQYAKNETLGLFKQGLDDFSISRQKVKWGIDLPFDEKQTIYVWVDALLNYLTGNASKEFEDYWKNGVVIHLLAKDILKFHAVYWPAMLLAAGKKVPDQEFIHGFFTINSQKMSKTLGNIINPNDLIEEFGVDGVRYLLLSQFPFGQDGDIKEERFVEKYNADLANGLGNLISRVLTLAIRNKIQDTRYEPDNGISEKVKKTRTIYEKNMKEFRLYEALGEVWKLISYCDEYVEKNKPWELAKTDKDNLKKVVSDLLYCVSEIADLIKSFLPETSGKIKKQLKLGKSETLFPRL